MRPRPYEAHVAAYDIPELGQFIQAAAAQECTDPAYSAGHYVQFGRTVPNLYNAAWYGI